MNNRTIVCKWNKNGDHPKDGVGYLDLDLLTNQEYTAIEGAVVRFFRHPDVPGTKVCKRCKQTYHDHGWIDQGEEGINVCPGDWIVTLPDGTHFVNKNNDIPEAESIESAAAFAIGAASTCWENVRAAGTFDSTRARVIMELLLHRIHIELDY